MTSPVLAVARKPRVAVLGEKFFPSRGGTSRVVESTVRQLANRYDFTVYCYANEAAENHVPGVRVVAFRRLGPGSLGVFLYYARCALHALRSRYDLVHVHKTDAAFTLPLLSRRFPCVATSHEVAYLNDKWSFLGRAYFRLAERVFVRARARRTCVSREQQRHYRVRYGCEVLHVPNGVEPPAADDAAARELLERAGVRPGFLLFAARRIIPLKGAHTLLAALHELGFRGQLVVLGDSAHAPAYCERLRAEVRGLDVRFLGYVGERATLLGLVRRAATFVFPSEREGMSVMLLEVAACGTPVLCSDIPQNQDVLGLDEAVLFASGDAHDLAAKLRWMETHPDEVRARAARARAKVEERFSAGGVAAQYAELYAQVLAERGPAPSGAATEEWATLRNS